MVTPRNCEELQKVRTVPICGATGTVLYGVFDRVVFPEWFRTDLQHGSRLCD